LPIDIKRLPISEVPLGYGIRIQKVQRPTNKSFYVTLPTPIAEALNIAKGEEFFWEIEDKNTLILRRNQPVPPHAQPPQAKEGSGTSAEGN
jgi:bifunctional DNA-binding transcriptional regulator/antitoxin component of YhaV-PrlF toxin-antitoxin module